MSLKEYTKKRTFTRTPEPAGRVRASQKTGELRFVIQKHHASHLHYDLRLELDGTLKSWAVPKGPSLDPSVKRLAMHVEDHPLDYMTFEGIIPKGNYGAGEVIVWDIGAYRSSETADAKENIEKLRAGYEKGHLNIIVYGSKIKGLFSLVKIKGGDAKNENAWLLIKQKDEFASKEDVTRNGVSVLSGETIESLRTNGNKRPGPRTRARQKKKDPMPRDVRPMLATLTAGPFDRPGWFFEVKWDGYRAIAEIRNDDVALYSRKGNSFAHRYPPVLEALRTIRHEAVLDGEIIALKDGISDFHTLQNYEETKAPLQYAIFDLLYLDGEDLRGLSLRERKERLKAIIPEHPTLLFSEHVEEKGREFFKAVTARGLEGVIAKDAESVYYEGRRSDAWQKIKSYNEQEAVIVGFTEPRGSRKKFGALVLAAHDEGKLRYIGHSGGGFTEAELGDMYAKLVKIARKTSPIKEKVPVNSPITWVRPQYVCEIRFIEWTPDGRMRHPIYAGLREDKDPSEVMIERPDAAKLAHPPQFTNLDKVFWPDEGYTKGDVIAYYEKIADVILPYLKDRPESLHRHPNGITGKSFFHKDIEMEVPPFVRTHKIWSETNDKKINYLLCQNKETLLYLANLGCIELNPWNSTVKDLEKPDYMIIDLDPGGNAFEDLVTVAQEVRKVLEIVCEDHLCKTSGKTGLHIVVPLGARYDYAIIRTFAELLVRIVHQRIPGLTSIERNPRNRKGKIYLDHLQNRRGQTLAAPYSLRPWPGATVSTPLKWSEVRKGLDPQKFTIKTIFKRLKKHGDLWRPVLEKAVDLKESIRCLEEHEMKKSGPRKK